MKKLTIASKVFGPYQSASIQSDHYLLDGMIFPFTVVGAGGLIEDWTDLLPSLPATDQEQEDQRNLNSRIVIESKIKSLTRTMKNQISSNDLAGALATQQKIAKLGG